MGDIQLTRSDSSLSSIHGGNHASKFASSSMINSFSGSINPVLSDSLNPGLSRSSSHVLESITTPVPQTNPLQGGILMQEPYQTDAYDRFPGEDAFFTPYRVTVMSPSLLQACSSSSPGRTDLPNELLAAFDTNKVAKRGTLQRLKMRNREEHSDDRSETIDEVSDVDMEDQEHAESVLGKLSASFDEKMRLLLDPDYCVDNFEEGELDNLSTQVDPIQQLVLEAGTKKELDDVKNALLRDKANKKVELRRSARVDKNSEPEVRKSVRQETDSRKFVAARQEPVLRQVNNRKPLKRSDSLTKKEKTELNLKTKEVEKENKVMKLKEHFEQGGSTRNKNLTGNPQNIASLSNFDVNKVRKKLSDSRNRRIKRRHTVGGTKDFTENILSKMNPEKSKSSWDRLAPMISNQQLAAERNERWNEERDDRDEREERRLSLPDCGGTARPIESHV